MATRQVHTVTDITELEIEITDVDLDSLFVAYQNGTLMTEGQDFDVGPGFGKITLLFTPSLGDILEFRRQ